jgi:uncharacterized protein
MNEPKTPSPKQPSFKSPSNASSELLFILGVGGAPMDPMNDLSAALRLHGIALEVMSTPAACRTWNVLMSEGRTAVTGLYDVA